QTPRLTLQDPFPGLVPPKTMNRNGVKRLFFNLKVGPIERRFNRRYGRAVQPTRDGIAGLNPSIRSLGCTSHFLDNHTLRGHSPNQLADRCILSPNRARDKRQKRKTQVAPRTCAVPPPIERIDKQRGHASCSRISD